ncbi:hypothetical protein Tco_0940856 [Tanacetum coccineum]|uniref:Uncharacterized protein n=1 Tax=Tanacetum coccineum TaxID=301880 RepID=A0ABQ5DP64_9ASTR
MEFGKVGSFGPSSLITSLLQTSPDPVAIVTSRAVDPIGSPSSTTIDQDEQSTSTSPTNQEIQSQVTHQGTVPQFHELLIIAVQERVSWKGRLDQIRSDLTPNRQESLMTIISSGRGVLIFEDSIAQCCLEAIRIFVAMLHTSPFNLPDEVYLLRKGFIRLKQAQEAWYDDLSNFLMSKCSKAFSDVSLPEALYSQKHFWRDTVPSFKLWLSLYINTVVLRFTVSHSNLMQSRTALSYKAHPYSVSLHKGTEHPSDTKVFTMKMEILLEPTSKKLMLASTTLNIQAFKIKKSVSISFRMTQVHKTAKDHMMMIRDYDWMMISKKLKDHIQVKIMPKSLKFTASDSQDMDK